MQYARVAPGMAAVLARAQAMLLDVVHMGGMAGLVGAPVAVVSGGAGPGAMPAPPATRSLCFCHAQAIQGSVAMAAQPTSMWRAPLLRSCSAPESSAARIEAHAPAAAAAPAPSLPACRSPGELARWLQQLARTHGAADRQLPRAVTAALKAMPQAPTPPELTAIACALARMGVRGKALWLLLSMVAVDSVPHMSAGQLAALCWAFSAVDHHNQAVLGAAADAMAAHVKAAAYKLQPSSSASGSPDGLAWPPDSVELQAGMLATMVAAMARLRHHHAGLLDAAALAAQRSSGRLCLSELVTITHACAVLNHVSLPMFDAAGKLALRTAGQQQQQQAQAEQLQRRIPPGDLECLPDLAWSFMVAGVMDVQVLEAAVQLAVRLGPTVMSQQQLSHMFEVGAGQGVQDACGAGG